MATFAGNDGVVKVATATVAEVRSFTVNETGGVVDDTAMGDTWRSHITDAGLKSWDGTIECMYDKTDATGQEALTVGTQVVLHLLPDGTEDLTGNATITGITSSNNYDDQVVVRSFTFVGNGVLSKS